MPEAAKPRRWWESQKVMVALIAGLALLASLTVLVALGKIEVAGELTPDAIVDAVKWLAGFVIAGRAAEGAATALRRPSDGG